MSSAKRRRAVPSNERLQLEGRAAARCGARPKARSRARAAAARARGRAGPARPPGRSASEAPRGTVGDVGLGQQQQGAGAVRDHPLQADPRGARQSAEVVGAGRQATSRTTTSNRPDPPAWPRPRPPRASRARAGRGCRRAARAGGRGPPPRPRPTRAPGGPPGPPRPRGSRAPCRPPRATGARPVRPEERGPWTSETCAPRKTAPEQRIHRPPRRWAAGGGFGPLRAAAGRPPAGGGCAGGLRGRLSGPARHSLFLRQRGISAFPALLSRLFLHGAAGTIFH